MVNPTVYLKGHSSTVVEVTPAGVYGKHSVSKGHSSTVVEVTPAGVYGKHSVSKGAQWLK